MKVHHSTVHGESIAGAVVECDHCGSETSTQPSKVEKLDHHFCNQECEASWRSNRFSGAGSPRWKGGFQTLECEYCGAEIERRETEIESSEQNFCSYECKGNWRSENWDSEDYPRWKGGKVSFQCEHCGEEAERRRDQVEKYERQFCSPECLGKWRSSAQRGSDNPVWTGGRKVRNAVRQLIGGTPWEKIADSARDNECELCHTDSTSDGRSMAVHHIVPVMAGGCNAETLLMTLCPSCHRKVEAYTRQFVEPVLVE